MTDKTKGIAAVSSSECVMPHYRVLPPELRNTFPAIHRGFDIQVMKLHQEFIGCEKCGVQMNGGFTGIATSIQCPNCLTDMQMFRVTQADLDALRHNSELSRAGDEPKT